MFLPQSKKEGKSQVRRANQESVGREQQGVGWDKPRLFPREEEVVSALHPDGAQTRRTDRRAGRRAQAEQSGRAKEAPRGLGRGHRRGAAACGEAAHRETRASSHQSGASWHQGRCLCVLDRTDLVPGDGLNLFGNVGGQVKCHKPTWGFRN